MDRKVLLREYKESRRPMGIYRVLNRANGKVLVGSSVNVPAMLNRHQAQLKLGMHQNRALQADWQAFGPDAFEFEVLDILEPPDQPDYDPADDLRALEEMWLEKLSPFEERGYNARPKQRV
jgi:group I intron endonuclease